MINNATLEKIRFNYTVNNDTINMAWGGESTMQYPSKVLIPYFESIIKEIRNENLSKIICDFTKLDYMNSGTVQPIIYFLKGLDTLGIPVTVIYNPHIQWQCISFKALTIVANILKNITINDC